jgi:rhodanese-related sulfurtransferase
METVVIIICGIVAASMLMRWYEKVKLRRAGVVEVNATETEQLIREEGALVVDVREVREYQSGRIPLSRNIALRELGARLDELEGERHRPIIVSCRSGRRSASAGIFLCRNGFSSVYNLKGGVTAWLKSNRKLER